MTDLDLFEESRPRRVRHVYLLDAGTVAVFDETHVLMHEYLGREWEQIRSEVLSRATPDMQVHQ